MLGGGKNYQFSSSICRLWRFRHAGISPSRDADADPVPNINSVGHLTQMYQSGRTIQFQLARAKLNH